MKILTVVGARPQFIKAAMVSQALREKAIDEVLVHTGQHYDDNMSQIFFEELELPEPDFHLGIGGGSHGQNTGRMIEALEAVMLRERPDWVLVYGDTDSTLAGALAAVKLHIPVAHVEAGLRSFNRRMPEEIHRVLTDHTADLLFSPTQKSVQNLYREGIPADRVCWVGDVMYDAALYYAEKAERKSCVLGRYSLEAKSYILFTIHRAENTDDPTRLDALLKALSEVNLQVPVVFPIHPRTLKRAECFGFKSLLDELLVIEPVGYLDMIMLERNARLIATDSGGVQKEAYFYRVPCVVLRNETEWVELVEMGWNRLANTHHQILETLTDGNLADLSYPGGIFGDGRASEKIAGLLEEKCG